jgi:hypothetical protein
VTTEEANNSGEVWNIYLENGAYKVGSTWSSFGARDKTWNNLEEVANKVLYLETKVATQETQMREDRAELASLREEVKLFSTFEQICNSGMLRNFKIDPEGDFAQVILGLLQRTMELQINHLAGPAARSGRPKLIQGQTPQQEAS